MRTVEIEPTDLQAVLGAIPEQTPVVMLNLLRYRERANYGGRTDIEDCSGRDAYHQRYVPAMASTVAAEGIRLFWAGTALARVVGPVDERWHEILLVEYPSFAAFRRLIENSKYEAETAPHRRAALEDWRLIAMTPGF